MLTAQMKPGQRVLVSAFADDPLQAIDAHMTLQDMLAPDPATSPADFNQTWGTLAPAALEAPRHRDLDVERYEQCLAESAEYPLLPENAEVIREVIA